MNKKMTVLSIIASALLLSACSSSTDIDTIEETIIETETVEETTLETESDIETIEETELEEETVQESDTETEVEDKKELKNSDYIKLLETVKVYRSAEDAFNNTNSVDEYSSGEYYVYKITDIAINITKNQGNPGGWINFDTFKYELLEEGSISDQDTSEESLSETQKETNNDEKDLSKEKTMSWSWAYPDTSKYMASNNAIHKISGSNSLYLTFDNGYEYNNLTSDILDVLKNNNVKAVFFTTSDYLRDNPSLAQRIIYEGHNLSNHTHKHLHQGEVSKNEVIEDIKGWEQTYRNVLGLQPNSSLMRPPAGSYNINSLEAANELGYKTVFWNYAYADWEPQNQPDPRSSLKKLLDNNEKGSIILLHSVSQTNADILDDYIKESKAQGFTFELLK